MCISLFYYITDLKNSFHIIFDLILHVHVVIHHLKICKKCNIFKITRDRHKLTIVK